MSVKEAGRKGGKARVPKGFAVLTAEERSERARQGALARWGAKKAAKGRGEEGPRNRR